MTTHTAERATKLRAALADALEASGQLSDPTWRNVFETVPRHVFVPEFWALTDGGRRHVTAADEDWLDLVYTDDALATQMTDGVATSSSTAPGLMLQMLQALDVAAGHRVLEVATGTGYNAALLSERLGSGLVTTVEVDPALADLAHARLKGCGYTPLVVAGDGRAGYPARAPYDRLIATCGFSRVPTAWLEQVRPGGVILAPLGWGTVRLIVGDDGRAEGRFLPTGSYFMAVRDAGSSGTAPHPGRPDAAINRPTVLDLAAVAEDEAFRFLKSLAAPDLGFASERGDDGLIQAVELWAADGSWARAEHGTVRQAGPRLLWDAVEAAHMLFVEHGRPGRERFGVTVSAEGQRIWLDHPGQEVFHAGPLG
ncbi:methyltransferase domain-containing protein [Streptomyces gibsoniae]|uniref:Protein-L-isoaspartate O-methyltransferase n=1 Tax=Streptomyces gibsoniae TaxID=3075529 RepID=A0ABU2U1Y1_9ACTN|nr:protein-L-isoaspartate(D-aspartate) O-methyltransferase [Streptomyces sp. DSM 41699]MDT0467056.1 protein-L-isoaspartate(D-aspartate) O-methyltransferase [Streptomyces sp. DSM 41699]